MHSTTRRGFLHAAAAAPLALSSAVADEGGSANDRITLALIGAGGRGADHAKSMAGMTSVRFKYVCDVMESRCQGLIGELAGIQGVAPQACSDMREVFDDRDVDGVIIATPEHWHALATVWACQAGKDVYVEKNPSMTIWEGRKMIEAAEKYGRIVQVGFQNRSGPYAESARTYLQAGKLGRIVHVKVYNLLGGSRWQRLPDGQIPPGFDWDAWLGPANWHPYTASRHLDWHPWWDYKGGSLADDASHQLDLARMVLGDPAHPRSVVCFGGNHAFQSEREVPEFQCISYDFGDFTMTCENGNAFKYMAKFPPDVRYGTQWPHWPTSATRIEIYGTDALMYLGRHGCGWQVVDLGGAVLEQDKGHFPDKWHRPDFLESMRTRKRPKADLASCHASACLVHLANTSYRVGQKQLQFDAASELFTNSDEANALQRLPYRDRYRIPDRV
jgi:predicted dehydrogenase